MEKQPELGYCRSECTLVQRACQGALRGHEDTLVSLLLKGTGPKKTKEKMCKKLCGKKRPKISDWKDEPFEARDQKEAER